MDASQPSTRPAAPTRTDRPAHSPGRREIHAIAQATLEGVRHGCPQSRIIAQLLDAGLAEAQAHRLVQYARQVELLSAAGTLAAEGVRQGRSPRQILDQLRHMGVDDLVAAGIQDRARQHYLHSLLRSGTILLAMGLLWFAAAVGLLLRTGLHELTLILCSLAIGLPLTCLGHRQRTRATALQHTQPDA